MSKKKQNRKNEFIPTIIMTVGIIAMVGIAMSPTKLITLVILLVTLATLLLLSRYIPNDNKK